RPPLAFTLKTGPTCRSWDDFLIVSAQRWADLREELTSGRLAAYLASIGRADLAPPPDAPGTPDERLDAWLAALPTTKANQPELDVHPRTLSLRVTPGGGSTRRKVRVANAGHRLLRWSARIEPAGTPWLALAPEFAGKTIPTVEEADLPIDVMIPDRLDRPLSAALVIESNGGTQRVAVSLEPSAPADVIPEAAAPAPVRAGWGWRDPIASLSPRTRIIAGALSLAGLRLAVALLGPLVHPRAEATPDLAVAAFLLAVLGSLGGARLSRLRGTRRDMPSGALTGALLGILVATMYVAACRSIEPLLGKTLSGSALVVVMLWGLIGAGLAALSQRLIPPRTSSEGP
ncbi:MAG: hypothetical protein IRY99_16145, partial [Isosphaeraceae bacterium]|nr:hypothetical protein [Isosphaeraceae bacterium]